MVRRNRRQASLFVSDAEKIVADLHHLHDLLMVLQRRLTPGTEHYQAIDALSETIIRTIRSLSGKDPEWMQVKTSELKSEVGL